MEKMEEPVEHAYDCWSRPHTFWFGVRQLKELEQLLKSRLK
jgi:hypothetical protein